MAVPDVSRSSHANRKKLSIVKSDLVSKTFDRHLAIARGLGVYLREMLKPRSAGLFQEPGVRKDGNFDLFHPISLLEDFMRRLLMSVPIAILGAALIAMPVTAAPRSPLSKPVGIVLQADHATVGADVTSENSILYEGDILQTGPLGTLHARLSDSQVDLFPSTSAQIHGDPNGFSASLSHGTVVASSAEGQSFEVIADGVTIRAASPHSTIAQITWVDARRLLLSSRHGTLLVFMGDELETIEPGSTYRLEIQPAEPDPQGPKGMGSTPQHAAHNHFILIAIAAIAVGAGIGIWRLTVSPNSP